MTLEMARETAKKELVTFQCSGYVIFKNPNPYYKKYDLPDYDFELFDDYDQLKKFVSGAHAYNHLDFGTWLRDGDKVIECYDKSKIIIM